MSRDQHWTEALRHARSQSECRWGLALTFSVLLGFWGVDRFYVGRYGLGTLKLLSAGGALIWWLADIYLLLTERMVDGDGNYLRRVRL